MYRHTLVRAIERTYRALPLSPLFKRRMRDIAFTRFAKFFSVHPAYQRWATLAAQPQSDDAHLWERYGKFPSVEAPTAQEWGDLAKRRADSRGRGQPLVDVIIPVYDGYDETLRALYNAIAADNSTPHEVIAISDCGPNEVLNKTLDELAAQGLFTLLKNEENLGFVQTVNRGFGLHLERDVLILNADAFVQGNYLDRMRAHTLTGRVATVTPLTSNGEICSYPLVCRDNSWNLELSDTELDSLASAVNRGMSVPIPTGVGFCMYITRDALSEVGFFDAETFGKGYGEENDFCVRATTLGYTHLLSGDVFVRHAGGVSFSERKLKAIERAMKIMEERHPGYNSTIATYIAHDPAHTLRQRLDIARLTKERSSRRSFLFVFHNWGGGTEKHARDMAKWLRQEGVSVFALKPSETDPTRCSLSQFEESRDIHAPNLWFRADEQGALTDALTQLEIEHIHIHHLVGYDEKYYALIPKIASHLGISFDITIHDYFAFCPRIHLIGSNAKYCGEPDVKGCTACIKQNGSPAGIVDVREWRARYAALFADARHIFVPDQDVAARLGRYFPGTSFQVRPHPESWEGPRESIKEQRDGKVRVALLGALFELKGAHVLRDLVKDAYARKLPIEFHLIGYYGVYDPELLTYPNLFITGKYEERDVGNLIRASRATIALLPAVWPETFSYTLSLAFHHGLFPISFDLGAPANRIRACGWGELWPVDLWKHPAKMNDRLCSLTIPQQPEKLSLFDKEEFYPSLLKDYYAIDLQRAQQDTAL